MTMTRRRILHVGGVTAAATAVSAAPVRAWASPSFEAASQFGLRPDSADDQTPALQRALDRAAETRSPLFLPPGVYRIDSVRLRSGARLVGVAGATRIVATGAGPLLTAERAENVGLCGLVVDGLARPIRGGRGLISLKDARHVEVDGCVVDNAGTSGIHLESCEGAVTNCAVSGAQQTGIFSRDAAGLRITDNTVSRCGNNGIQVWRSQPGHDGAIVTGNRVTDIAARDGGSGQNGNGINLYRANGVIVANNSITGCAYSAVRANSASAVQILGNNCGRLGEVALYVEFGTEGAVVANNLVDGASIGLSMTNFNEGGRLGVAQGNLFRNLLLPPTAGNDPSGGWGIGIHVEADAAVTGNVIETAANVGISIGWAHHLRDVTASSNVIRNAPIGVAVSVSAGAGAAVVKDNLISGASKGGVLGFDRKRAVTGDLAREMNSRFAQLSVSGNVVR